MSIFRANRVHCFSSWSVIIWVISSRSHPVENVPESCSVLIIFWHTIVFLCHWVWVYKSFLIKLVDELECVHIRSVWIKTVIELSCVRIIKTKIKLIITKVSCCKRLYIHNHVSIPVVEKRNTVSWISIIICRTSFLHLYKHINQIVQIFYFRLADFFIKVKTQIPGIEEAFNILCWCRNTVSKAVKLFVRRIHKLIFLQSHFHICVDVRTPGWKELVCFPVKEHSFFTSLTVFVGVIAPNNNVAKVSCFHTCLISTACFRNDVKLYVKLFQHYICEPACL